MAGEEKLEDEIGFIHDPYRDMHTLHLLDEAGAVSKGDDEKITDVVKDTFSELEYLSFFAFYYRERISPDDAQDWGYLILGEDLFASLLSDEDVLRSPIQSAHIKRQPLSDLGHAFGNCQICPAKTFLGSNLGNSNVGESVGLVQDIEIPNTFEYSMYSEEGNQRWSHDEYGDCSECQEFMSVWFREKIREQEDYLWGMGGTGLVHELSLDTEEYNILEAIAGRTPQIETLEDDFSLLQRDKGQLDERINTDPGPEYVFNLIIAAKFCAEFEFDDFKANCEISEPYELVSEYDVLLINYDLQKIVVIETTAQSKISSDHLRKKHTAAYQLSTLAEKYDFELQYIYVTTGKEDDLRPESGTTLVQNEWDVMEIVCCQPDNELSILNADRAINTSPSEFGEEFRDLYETIAEETKAHISSFVD